MGLEGNDGREVVANDQRISIAPHTVGAVSNRTDPRL